MQPENVLFESPTSFHVKLRGLGLSCRYNPSRPLESQLATLQYMAPERMLGQYDWESDIWSIGVVVFELVCGMKPFLSDNVVALVKQIGNAKFRFDNAWHSKTKESISFCRHLLKKEALDRPTASDALDHPWFRTVSKKSRNSSKQRAKIVPRTSELESETIINYESSPALQTIVRLWVASPSFPSDIRRLRQVLDECDVEGTNCIASASFRKVLSLLGDKDITAVAMGLTIGGEVDYMGFLRHAVTMYGYTLEEKVCDIFDSLASADQSQLSAPSLHDKIDEKWCAKSHPNHSTCKDVLLAARNDIDQLTTVVLKQSPKLCVTV